MCCPSRVGFRGNLSIRPRMAVALVPARGRRLTSCGRYVDFPPQPSAIDRSAAAPVSAALVPGQLPGDGTFVLTRRAEEPRPVTARLRAQAARWNTTYASCTRIRLSPAASLLPTWSASRSVSGKGFAFAARKWCIVGHRSSRRPVLRLVDVSRS